MILSETICTIMNNHISQNDGLIMGETLTSIGNTYGTIPKNKGNAIIELPMSDVAASGFATGAALVGRKTVFVLRFQDFFMLNSSSILQDAAISKEMFGVDCPLFVRAIGSEKAGPNHSNVMHSIPMHFPGMKVCAPMSSEEYIEVYDEYLKDLNPVFVSEDRRALNTDFHFRDVIYNDADITLFAIADARLEVEAVAEELRVEGYVVNVAHIMWLKPFNVNYYANILMKSKVGLVIDSDREICGASEHIACSLIEATGKIAYVLGSDDCVKTHRSDNYHESPKKNEILTRARMILKK